MEKNYEYYFNQLQRGLCFEYIPVEFRDKKMCFEAVFNHRGYIRDIPKEVWDSLTRDEKYEWCLNGVKSTPFNIQHIPLDIIDEKMCLIVASGSYSYLIQHIPDSLKTYDVCLAAVSKYTNAIQHVPDRHKTYDLCLTAVKNIGFALEHVPNRHKTFEMCFEAVNKNGNALRHVPDSVLYSDRGYELCLLAVERIGEALEDVPSIYKTQHLCQIAMNEEHYSGLEFVPEEFIEYDQCLKVIGHCNGYYLKYVPEKFRDYKMCRHALQSHGEAFEYVPEALRSNELYELALDNVYYDPNSRQEDNDAIVNDFKYTYWRYGVESKSESDSESE